MNILFLTHRFPYPPNRGDRIRSYHILRHLAAQHDVYLASLNDEVIETEDYEHVAGLCADLHVVRLRPKLRYFNGLKSALMGRTITEGMFANRQLHTAIDAWQRTTDFDAEFVFCSSMYQYVSRLHTDGAIPRVVDLVDVDSIKWEEYSQNSWWPKSTVFSLESRRIGSLERRIVDESSATTLVSDAEAKLFRKRVAATRGIHGISNGVNTDYFTASQAETSKDPHRFSMLFVGVLDYKPNVDGVVWFAKEVWPKLYETNECLRFEIVGRRPSKRVLELSQIEGVEVLGEVDDVRPHLDSAGIVIAPLKIARGLQNKVLEAMAMEKPVIASPQALEGIEFTEGKHAIQAGSPAEWQSACTKLFEDDTLRRSIGLAARELIVSNYSWAARLKQLDTLFEKTNRLETTHKGTA